MLRAVLLKTRHSNKKRTDRHATRFSFEQRKRAAACHSDSSQCQGTTLYLLMSGAMAL